LFFACAGAVLLREHYKLPATVNGGTFALMTDGASSSVLVFGRQDGDAWRSDTNAFHVWNECNGWLIDFMAPIYGVSASADGASLKIPARMLQKQLVSAKECPEAIQEVGDYCSRHDGELVNEVVGQQPAMFDDLLQVCRTWFRKPPRPMPPIGLGDTHGSTKTLHMCAPTVIGAW
jgi:hypothetical protein